MRCSNNIENLWGQEMFLSPSISHQTQRENEELFD